MRAKKIISLFLSLVMLVSVMAGTNAVVQAATYYESESNNSSSNADWITVNSSIEALCPENDGDWFKFHVNDKKYISVSFSHDYGYSGKWKIKLQVFNPGSETKFTPYYDFDYIYADSSSTVNLFTGYLQNQTVYIQVCSREYYGYPDDVNYTISVRELLPTPSKLKVSSRSTNAMKLSWSKVSGVSGYQLQRRSGDSWKTVATTTSTSSTVKSLKVGTTYNFRVRAYKTINGTKYYSGWRTLKTPTSPSKPGIKTPSTNKKHQITAKWKKVSACSGYQVQFSTSSKFKKATTKTVSGASKTSCTGKFKKGKKYYIRVRSYKTVDGKKYYSAWSSVKSIKCK